MFNRLRKLVSSRLNVMQIYFSPHSLFGRFLVIFLLPIILLQCINCYIFYQRHWGNVTSRMQEVTAQEVGVICSMIKKRGDYERNAMHVDPLGVNLSIRSGFLSTIENKDKDLSELEDKLAQRIKSPFVVYYVDKLNHFIVEILLQGGDVIAVKFSSRRIQSPTAEIFIAWMLGSSILVYGIAMIFMRNQVRSIAKLAEFAEALGKGQQDHEFHPSGAAEIKGTGRSIILMRDRIERQIKYRTEMLAHISHDLRTPLTRMKLLVAMLSDQEKALKLNENLSEISNMVSGYLNFAKEEGNERSELTDVKTLVQQVVKSYQSNVLKLVCHNSDDMILALRPSAIKRALSNLIDNALRHADQTVKISLLKDNRRLTIGVEDDGPGLDEDMFEKIFRPFFKVNNDGEGYGLGLSIVKSVVTSHGGDVILKRAELGGLLIKIRIPI